ncbi:cysteine-rich venom protein 6-like [Ambystoma mexicanum]|uniref:cysteine-rich venom protein 6-like n=1 Tax=Ambystoma mexicanum TaxID=8296 RepID=UPI0037E71E25
MLNFRISRDHTMYSRRLILFGLTSVFSLVVGNESTYSKCADNMHYMECGSGCPRTCADVNNTHTKKHICEIPCKSGCFCNDGSSHWISRSYMD